MKTTDSNLAHRIHIVNARDISFPFFFLSISQSIVTFFFLEVDKFINNFNQFANIYIHT